jgi:hypothetical protein
MVEHIVELVEAKAAELKRAADAEKLAAERPLPEVMKEYLDELLVAAHASDSATIKALRSWLAKR